MKKQLLIIGSLVFTVIIIALPFFLPPEVNESLVTASNVVSSIASLATLMIAILLFSKYGVEKSVLDRQTDATVKLLTELKKTRFIFEYEGGMVQVRLNRLKNKYWNKYEDKNLRFDMWYAETLKDIWDLSDDIFLPIEIAQRLEPLILQDLIGEKKQSNNVLRVQIPGSSVNFFTNKKDYETIGLLNGKEMTLGEFIQLWNSVVEIATSWLKSHSSVDIELNFEREK